MLSAFEKIWSVDFEFRQPNGHRPEPICAVAQELWSGRLIRLWRDEMLQLEGSPFDIGSRTLFVAYYASAEVGCHIALGWPMPSRILDLYAEFSCLTSGLPTPCGRSLLGAMAFHGLDAAKAVEKESMRQLAMRGGPFTAKERRALLDYCQRDVDALVQLLRAMAPGLDLPRALLRGRYMAAVAHMERNGIPIDVPLRTRMKEGWEAVRRELVAEVDKEFEVYDGTTFKHERFARYLAAQGISWPRLSSGALALDDETFRLMAKAHSQLGPLRELRRALSDLRRSALAIGPDGRNRCLLSAFGSKTGRNQPSNSKFIFGPSVWLRGLIKPGKGRALAYVDWCQQEFGIAAALSGDAAMMQAYRSGDPYLAFAQQAGAAPDHATRNTHGKIRERFKICALAVQYGMGPQSLALLLGGSDAEAKHLLDLHRHTYPVFWRWSQAAVDHAMLRGYLHTVFGWRVHAGLNPNPRSLANFPMQANGAEMMRLAACLATERGVTVCAPVHDAFLIEAPINEIDGTVAATQAAMREASEVVLGGFALRTDAQVVRYPDRYMDPRGEVMWNRVMAILNRLDPSHGGSPHVSRDDPGPCPTAGHPCHLVSPIGI